MYRGVTGVTALLMLLALAARLGAAILNAAAPLFTALFAPGVDRAQRVTGVRLVGICRG